MTVCQLSVACRNIIDRFTFVAKEGSRFVDVREYRISSNRSTPLLLEQFIVSDPPASFETRLVFETRVLLEEIRYIRNCSIDESLLRTHVRRPLLNSRAARRPFVTDGLAGHIKRILSFMTVTRTDQTTVTAIHK